MKASKGITMLVMLLIQMVIVNSFKTRFDFRTPSQSTLQNYQKSNVLHMPSPLYAAEVSNILAQSYDTAAVVAMITSISTVTAIENVVRYQDQTARIKVSLWQIGLKSMLSLLLAGLTLYVFNKTSTVSMKFDETSMSLIDTSTQAVLTDPVPGRGEGVYRWKYEDIINYALLPSEKLPVFLYFKESSTTVENRVEGPFYLDNLPGQIHLFPIIFNIDQLEENLEDPKHHLIKTSTHGFHVQTNVVKFVTGLKIL